MWQFERKIVIVFLSIWWYLLSRARSESLSDFSTVNYNCSLGTVVKYYESKVHASMKGNYDALYGGKNSLA